MGAITPPQLTIELPTDVDPHVEKLLAGFHWPPRHEIVGHRPRMLSLRRRIPRAKLTEEESSVRFLESFWPSDPMYSHVLVLSPHTEVTPQFFHCRSSPMRLRSLQKRHLLVSPSLKTMMD